MGPRGLVGLAGAGFGGLVAGRVFKAEVVLAPMGLGRVELRGCWMNSLHPDSET